MRGKGGSCGVSANEYSCAHGAQINFEDLTPYLTYEHMYIFTVEWSVSKNSKQEWLSAAFRFLRFITIVAGIFLRAPLSRVTVLKDPPKTAAPLMTVCGGWR
jgi:hypothetical protein